MEKEELLIFKNSNSDNPIFIDNLFLKKGNHFTLHLNKKFTNSTNIIRIYLPSFIEAQKSSNLLYELGENTLSFIPNSKWAEITLKAARKGEGSIKIIVEPLHDTSNFKTYLHDPIFVQ
jgi:hypothetical protein